MRVTIAHNRPKEEVVRIVDRSFDDLFRGITMVPLQLNNEQRSWTGNTLHFSFNAKLGLVSAPIKGSVDVSDRDVTIEADLGWLERLIPAKQAEAALESRIRGLLK